MNISLELFAGGGLPFRAMADEAKKKKAPARMRPFLTYPAADSEGRISDGARIVTAQTPELAAQIVMGSEDYEMGVCVCALEGEALYFPVRPALQSPKRFVVGK